ncbi:hypothetical protein BC940DRAFT_124619 [Gongronella butleri]|nr:hypothetical protein BC940DRAFT_124619 [Gongronella butleri]
MAALVLLSGVCANFPLTCSVCPSWLSLCRRRIWMQSPQAYFTRLPTTARVQWRPSSIIPPRFNAVCSRLLQPRNAVEF